MSPNDVHEAASTVFQMITKRFMLHSLCRTKSPRRATFGPNYSRRCASIKGLIRGGCVRATFSVLYSLFLYTNTTKKCRSYRLKSSEPCNLHMRMRKGVPKCEKKPHLFLQKLLNFHYFLSYSLHLHYSHAFRMYIFIQNASAIKLSPQIYQIYIITGEAF
jgi:hypothetical protein